MQHLGTAGSPPADGGSGLTPDQGAALPAMGSAAGRIVVSGLALVALLVALHGLNSLALGETAILSIDADQGIASWLSCVAFLAAGQCWAAVAWLDDGGRWLPAAVATICVLLSMEAVVQLHTGLEESIGFAWGTLLVEPLVGIAVLAALHLTALRSAPGSRGLIWAAMVTLVVGQAFASASGNTDLSYWPLVLTALVEESLEILTAALLLAAAVDPAYRALRRRVRAEI